jgi:hypothetical protein
VPELPPTARASVELTGVPFFAQAEYQCGPAALATLLASAGAAVTADQLVPEVYVDGLHGSLQAELLAATRRHGLIPYVLLPGSEAMLAEIAAGRPVLVLQNLGLPRVPVWHYAVVVGYDAERDAIVLRSGTEQRRLERSRRFLRSWQRGAEWAFVAVEPGSLPATATPDAYVRALVDAERLLPARAADAAFTAALAHWPDDELVLFSAANRRLRAHDAAQAAALYRRVLELDPKHAAARNNLANALADEGCYTQALVEARTARSAVAAGDASYAAIDDTVATIERAAATAPERACR